MDEREEFSPQKRDYSERILALVRGGLGDSELARQLEE